MQPTLYASRLGYRFAEAGLTPADAGELVPELLKFADQPRTATEMEAWLEQRLGAGRKAGRGGDCGRTPRCCTPRSADRGPSPPCRRTSLRRPGPCPRAAWPGRRRCRPSSCAIWKGSGRVGGRRGAVRHGPAGTGPRRAACAERRRRGDAGTRRHDAVRRSRRPAPACGHTGPISAHGHVGQRPAGIRRPRPRDPPDYRALVTRNNGDVLPTLLVDGYVAGVWRPVDGGIEATAFHDLSPETWDGLAAEAESLTMLLTDHDPRVYSRYDHWWAKLSGAQGCSGADTPAHAPELQHRHRTTTGVKGGAAITPQGTDGDWSNRPPPPGRSAGVNPMAQETCPTPPQPICPRPPASIGRRHTGRLGRCVHRWDPDSDGKVQKPQPQWGCGVRRRGRAAV
ncbi:hypothetical protein STSP_36740 [Streptomyces jeddahensis]|uniref:Winged helix DNA-binding domain-containing protein n=1 Tax=Streptomyces jeddahensis TaxID=1716141 RepID=A0A177HRF6_9ACTN|nr:hypothetical protein STSP_36740 [Streptomyces jeddahensis]